jgi:heme/copper-type cytochrome/quinol oxidase subunit 3
MGVEPTESPLTPESWGKLGMWMFLAGDAMSFGALLAGYGALRYGSADWPVPAEVLGIQLTAFMTFLLICSSVTMVKGLEAIQHGDEPRLRLFLVLTVLGGVTFLAMQAYEWTHLIHRGLTLSGNPFGASLFSTTFFCLTGFHGCHVFGGVVYLAAVLGRSARGAFGAMVTAGVTVIGTLIALVITSKVLSVLVAVIAAAVVGGAAYLVSNMLRSGPSVYNAQNTNEVEIAALYWHFVDLVWILVFTFVYLI